MLARRKPLDRRTAATSGRMLRKIPSLSFLAIKDEIAEISELQRKFAGDSQPQPRQSARVLQLVPVKR